MKKWSLFIIFLALLFAPRPVQATNPSQTAGEMLTLINTFRTNNGLAAFKYNSSLAAAAQNQANYMAANTVFSSHVGAGGSTPQSRAEAAGFVGYVTENIVGGTNMSARQGLIWWTNSPVHYQALISTRHTAAGTGFATDGDQNFFVLVIGQTSNSPAPATGSATADPAPLIITPITLAQPGDDGSIVHTVQEGQALWTLAAYYEVPLTDLLLYNNLRENALVRPGDKILIRLADGAAPPPTPTPPAMHIVEEGQTLWTLAVIYNVRLGDLMLYNDLNESSLLQPGDEIVVRLLPGQQPPPTPTPVISHTIESGETLWDVALSYGLTLEELLALNPGLSADSIIRPGDEFLVRLITATRAATLTPTLVPTITATPELRPNEPTPLPPTTTAVPFATPLSSPEPTEVAIAQNGRVQEADPGRTTLLLVMGIGLVLTFIAGAGIWVLNREMGIR